MLPTMRPAPFRVVLVVGGSAELVARCGTAVSEVRALVAGCDVQAAATKAGQWRPLALVMTEDVYGFDPEEFDALAQAVSSKLVRIKSEQVSNEELRRVLSDAVREVDRMRIEREGSSP